MESSRTLRTVCQAGKDHDPGWYLFSVLKGFRLFIVALPGLAAAYVVEAVAAVPAITVYLAVSACALGAYVLFQVIDLWSGGMEMEIERATRTPSAGEVEESAPPHFRFAAGAGRNATPETAARIEGLLPANDTQLVTGGRHERP